MPTLVQNLFLFSEDLTNGAYTLSNVTVTPDAVLAPDGTLSADLMVENSANAGHVTTQNVTLATGRQFTWSVYAKLGVGSRLLILAPNAGTSAAWFDLVNGQVGTITSTAQNATIEPVSGAPGWFRCSVTFTNVSGFPQMQFYITNADASTTYAGDGVSSIAVWGHQIVEANWGGPYVKTTATAINAGLSLRILRDRKPMAQNLQPSSENLTNASVWANSSVTVVQPGSLGDPFGTQRAFRIAASGANTLHYVFSGITLPTFYRGVPRYVTVSCYLKRDPLSPSPWALVGNDRHSLFFRQYINLDTGVLGTAQNVVYARAVQITGDGWWRLEATYLMADATGGVGPTAEGMFIGPAPGDNVPSFAPASPNPESVLAIGAAFVVANHAGPYVPNNATVAARYVDFGKMRDKLPDGSNQFAQSEDFTDSTNWQRINIASVQGDVIPGPFLGTFGDGIVSDTSNAAHVMHQVTGLVFYPGKVVTYSVWAKAGATGWIIMGVNGGAQPNWFDVVNGVVGTTAGGCTCSITNAGNGWWLCQVVCINNGGSLAADSFLYNTTGNGVVTFAGDGVNANVYFFGAQLVEGSWMGPYVKTLNKAATRTPFRVLMQQPNQFTRSVDPSNQSSWTRENLAGVTANAGLDPFGGNTAADLVDNGSTANHDIFQSPATSVGSVFTASVWAKAVNRNFLVIWVDGFTRRAWFNLSTGALGSSDAGLTVLMEPAANGFYRCSVTWTQTSTTNGIVFGAANVDNAFSYTGSSTAAVRLFGPQCVPGDWPGPYVVTGATAAAGLGRFFAPPSQNLLPWSEDITQATWGKGTGVTVQGNTTDVTDPNGGNTAGKVVYDGSGSAGAARLFESSSVLPQGMAVTASIWIRTLSGSFTMILGNNNTQKQITLTTTWQRFEITSIPPHPLGEAVITCSLFADVADNTARTFYVWGAQAVRANWTGPYQKTTALAVSRGRIRDIAA